jgi:uncharacterized protein YjbI with pentapeptide repeats
VEQQQKEARKRTWPRGDSQETTRQGKGWMLRELGGKTVWDWLQLLIVPLALAVIGFAFTLQQDVRQNAIEERRAQAERELAEVRAQDAALQAYLDQMTLLILDRKLLEAGDGDPVYTLAQARTSTIIIRLDAEHNRSVTRFLTDSGMTGTERVTEGGDATVSVLRGLELDGADLSSGNLVGADLTDASLHNAHLHNAGLLWADLTDADLSNAGLADANLSFADLSADGASTSADLCGVVGCGASLKDADLSNANLFGANLSGADLSGADLMRADLTNAEGINKEELERQAKSLEGATMPDGSKHP